MPDDWFGQFAPATGPQPPAPPAPDGDFFAQFEPVKAPKAPSAPAPTSWFDSLTTFLDRATKPLQPSEIGKMVQAVNPLLQTGDKSFAQSMAERTQAGTHPHAAFAQTLAEWRPVAAAKGILQAQGQLGADAQKDFAEGRIGDGVVKAVNYLIPMLGPGLQHAGEELQAGNVAAGLGETAAIAGSLVGPVVAPKVIGAVADKVNAVRARGGVRVTPKVGSLNPAEAEAVAFGQARGVPVDAATATGNRFIKGADVAAESGTLAGSMIAEKARGAQQRSLATLGEQLAAKGHATATTKEAAGESVRQNLLVTAGREATKADTAYSALRKMEADPGLARSLQVKTRRGAVVPEGPNAGVPIADPAWEGLGTAARVPVTAKVPLGVDLRAAKSSLRPVYESLQAQKDATGILMGAKADTAAALRKLMDAPDAAPLSAVDGALGDLKAALRKGRRDGFLTEGQAATAQTVRELEMAVQEAAEAAGPRAVQALREGRAATIAKYDALDVVDLLNTEPVRTINALTAPKGGGIAKLREVARLAPDEMPKIGRAWLDEQLAVATEAGGFARADKLFADWQKLDPSTRHLIFKDPGYVRDLDNFFRLAKQVGDNPNPSGSARVGATVGHLATGGAAAATGNVPLLAAQLGYELTGAAVAKLMHSRRGVQLLTQGLRIPVPGVGRAGQSAATTAVRAKVVGDLARFAGPEWYRAPVFADEEGSPR